MSVPAAVSTQPEIESVRRFAPDVSPWWVRAEFARWPAAARPPSVQSVTKRR